MPMRLVAAGLLIPLVAACSGGSSHAGRQPQPRRSPVTPTASPPSSEVVASFKGSSSATTKPFDVKPGWELQYEIDGKSIGLELVDASGHPLAAAATYTGPGGGSLFPSRSGTLAVKVTATAKWRLHVINH